MAEPVDWLGTLYAGAISLAAVTLGVVARYTHKARRTATKIDWRRMRYEAPTIVGLTLVTGPTAAYLSAAFAVNEGVTAATAFCLGYLGTRVLDAIWRVAAEAEKDKEKAP